jgi:hypothetical protein
MVLDITIGVKLFQFGDKNKLIYYYKNSTYFSHKYDI